MHRTHRTCRLVASGARLRLFLRIVMKACDDAVNELHAEIGTENRTFEKVYAKWAKYRNEQLLWFRVAEKTSVGWTAATRQRKRKNR